jgi:hypothetical protein
VSENKKAGKQKPHMMDGFVPADSIQHPRHTLPATGPANSLNLHAKYF